MVASDVVVCCLGVPRCPAWQRPHLPRLAALSHSARPVHELTTASYSSPLSIYKRRLSSAVARCIHPVPSYASFLSPSPKFTAAAIAKPNFSSRSPSFNHLCRLCWALCVRRRTARPPHHLLASIPTVERLRHLRRSAEAMLCPRDAQREMSSALVSPTATSEVDAGHRGTLAQGFPSAEQRQQEEEHRARSRKRRPLPGTSCAGQGQAGAPSMRR